MCDNRKFNIHMYIYDCVHIECKRYIFWAPFTAAVTITKQIYQPNCRQFSAQIDLKQYLFNCHMAAQR